jgi:hypothetical protein
MAAALVAFRGAILPAKKEALPLIGGKVDNFLTQRASISSAGIDQDPAGSLIYS